MYLFHEIISSKKATLQNAQQSVLQKVISSLLIINFLFLGKDMMTQVRLKDAVNRGLTTDTFYNLVSEKLYI
jgi:hypothetical protein